MNSTNWAPGQPAANTEECVELRYNSYREAEWNVVSCKASRPTVCQNCKSADMWIEITNKRGVITIKCRSIYVRQSNNLRTHDMFSFSCSGKSVTYQ